MTADALRDLALPEVAGERGWALERVNAHEGVLGLAYKGHLEVEDGTAAAARCVELMGEEQVILLFDLSELLSFPAGLRVAWQEALWPRRRQIRGIVAACERPIPRMALSAFALLIGTHARLVEHRDELPGALSAYLEELAR